MTVSQARFFQLLAGLSFAFALAACADKEPVNPPVTGPNIKSFTATPTMVAQGATTVLAWEVEKAASISIVATPGGTLVDASTMLTGSMPSSALTADTSFKLTATDSNGKTKEQTVSVTIDQTALAIIRFEAVPNPAPAGGTTELRWQTTGATSVTIKNGATTLFNAPANQINQGSTLSPTLTNSTYTFTLEASNGTDTVTLPVTVTAEQPPTITSFTASPTTFTGASQMIALAWATTNASSIQLFQNGVAVPNFPATTATGTFMVTVMETTRFELVATSGGGEARASATVARTSPEVEPNDDYMTATPLTTGAATGDLGANDADFYSFTVPANGNVFASIKNPSDGMCPFPSAILTLLDPNGNELGSVFGGVDDECPNIDPTVNGFAGDLPAGTYYISVSSFGGMGPYTLVVIVGAKACGNGVFEMGELCDDNNTTNGDNCSATCQLEAAATINPPGGTATINTGVFVPTAPQPSEKWIQINLTQDGQSIEVTTGDVGGGCTINTYVLLIDSTPAGLGEAFDDGMGGDCAAIHFPQDSFAVGLMAGTYYLLVANDDQMNPATIEVHVTIHDKECGNGAVESGEQCDDGNTAAGDGCGASCQVEALGTLMGPPSSMTFSGSIDPGTQEDYYAITMTAPGFIFAETFAPTAPTCTPTTTDTIVRLLDSAFTQLQSNDDIGGGVYCSRLVPSGENMVQPGNYFIQVTSFPSTGGPRIIPAYQITIRTVAPGCGNGVAEMTEQCDDGNMMAGDGCDASCAIEAAGTVMGPPANQTFNGSLNPATSIDYYRVTLTAPGYIDAQVGSPNAMTCTPTTTDTVVRLLADDFTEINSNDNIDFFADNLCSHIEPTSAADLLMMGSYWVAVTGRGDPINYSVRIRASAPGCGNNIVETGETCDDGNMMNGDLCNSMCQFEGVNEVEPNEDDMHATPSTAGRNRSVVVGGAITPVGDIDVYSFAVTGAAFNLTARTHGNPADQNDCNDIDTLLTVRDAMGNEIFSNDDIDLSGGNYCSAIDGIGNVNPEGRMLAAGTYYLEVRHYIDTDEIPAYYMTVTIQ